MQFTTICSYQTLDITLIIQHEFTKAVVTTNGPMPHNGNNSFEYDISSNKLQRQQEYLMTVIVNNTFENFTKSLLVGKLKFMHMMLQHVYISYKLIIN